MSIEEIVKQTLQEDIGSGDHSSLACIDKSIMGKMKLLVKEDGVLCGVEVAKEVIRQVDPEIRMIQYLHDGDLIHKGDIVFDLEGPAQSMLTAERTLLNFMQRMSGIATNSKKYSDAVYDRLTEQQRECVQEVLLYIWEK